MCLTTSNDLLLVLQDAKEKKIPQTCNLLKNDADTFFHPPPPFPYNFCKRNSNGICTASQAYIQLPLLHTAWSSAYSEIGPKVAAATFSWLLVWKIMKGIHLGKRASLNCPTVPSDKGKHSKSEGQQQICPLKLSVALMLTVSWVR